MKIIKFLMLWLVLAIVMILTWSFGFVAGNAITSTSPPTGGDPIFAFYSFVGVCVFNSFLYAVLLWLTRIYSGMNKLIWLISFAFVVQFFLMQMESMFFARSLGMQPSQVVSIVIAGFITSTITVAVGVVMVGKMSREPKQMFTLGVNDWRSFLVPFALLCCIVYPFIYLVFGYYIAWQNENLRVLYTNSSELIPFFSSVGDSFIDGLYFFQILRAAIWVIVTIPLVIMLRHLKGYYLLVGLFSSVLAASQLFIPNPYMPRDIAMTHFVETGSSNFVWGMAIAFAVDKYLHLDHTEDIQAGLRKTTV